MFLLVYFQWLYLLRLFVFACLLTLGGLKVKNYSKINTSIKNVQYITMAAKSLKIKNESMFYPNDMIQLNNFDSQLLKINKREKSENNNIYYISYKINKPKHDINSINNLYLVVDHMYGKIEKINDSKDRYLVINNDNHINEESIIFSLFMGFYY